MPHQRTRPRICEQCGTVFSAWDSARTANKGRFCSPKCFYEWRRGANHHAWQGGKTINASGYVAVRLPDGSTILEHRLVMEHYLERPLAPEEIVHHIDGDTQHNEIANLRVLSRSEHVTLHNSLPSGRWAEKHAACIECGSTARKHAARGLCDTCYSRWKKRRRKAQREAAHASNQHTR